MCASSSTSATCGLPREDGVDVHLLERAAAVLELPPRHDLEVADLRRRLLPAVRLDEADDDVLAVVAPAPALVQHREGLADAGGGAEVDAELSSRHGYSLTARRLSSSARFSSRTFTPGSPRKPSERPSVCSSTRASTSSTGRPRARATRAACSARVLGRDVRVETRARRGHRVDRHLGVAGEPVQLAVRGDALRSTAVRSSSFVGPRFDAELDGAVVAVAGRGGPGWK